LCIDKSPRGTFRHVTASLPNQPLPFAADIQDGELTRAKRRAFEWKAAALVLREPVSGLHWSIIAKADHGRHLKRPFSRGSCRSPITHERADIACAIAARFRSPTMSTSWLPPREHRRRSRHSSTGRACSVGSGSLR
jgi:hypothetical protein